MALRDLIARLLGRTSQEPSASGGDVSAVMARNAESLMRMKGVMSVGVGQTADGEPAIVVGIDDPRAASVEDIPDAIDGVPVVHHTIGRPEARGPR